MRYRLSERAASDIVDLYVYGAREFGRVQAEKYHEGLNKCFAFLAANPRVARERHEFIPPVRIHVFGAYVVIYIIDEQGVFVVRVLGGAQDWARHLQ